jgi:hypothetical protein
MYIHITMRGVRNVATSAGTTAMNGSTGCKFQSGPLQGRKKFATVSALVYVPYICMYIYIYNIHVYT